jgi:hypothetical protein
MAIGNQFIGVPSGKEYVKLSLGPTEASKLYGVLIAWPGADKHIDRIMDALADAQVTPKWTATTIKFEGT